MAGAKRRSPTSTLVTKTSIKDAGSALVDLPEKPKEIWSLREAIDALKDEITLALDRGYTYPEISEMLTKRGVEISASTLKYYLSSVKRQDPNAKPRRRRRTLGASISAESLNLGVANPEEAEKPAAKKRGRAASTTKKTATAAKKTTTAAKTPAKRGRTAKTATAAKTTATKTRTTKAAAAKKTGTAATKKTTATKKTATKKTGTAATKKTATKKTGTAATKKTTGTRAKATGTAAKKTTATKAKASTGRGRRKATA
ncbi:hypothetical protein IQ266_05120 [filamentous cyanobacterium LEGE 11480]|uniref:Uncharacterized protein n=1 Tax=Romeriopsis navalis LEGE 11480 TaxID=2777977 RepID=A0A928VK63_9CYAN|nr:hypothetical protein [Romeriopsis navalis]MBE9029142.1 hypothetical protein [Romeriopsis navalis LEGE 11480]